MAGFSRTLTAQYDLHNNRTRLTHPDGQFFSYQYDPADRVGGITENATPAVIGITYDPPGRRSFVNRLNPWDSYYEYDPASRLTALVNSRYGSPNDVRFEYGYNPSSQMTARWASADAYSWTDHVAGEKAYAVNGLNQYTSVAAAPHTYDANGNLITDGTNTYIYDAENRLVSGTAAGQTTTLTYDPMGRLWQIVKGTANTRFLYDGDELVGEYDGAGALVKRYMHGPSVDEPMIQYDGAGLANRRFLEADERSSVILATDTAGATVAINRYDEYGIPAGTNQGRFQYTGQILLGELGSATCPGLYHYKARLYSPCLGRFLQTDPIGYEDQINLYAYVENDPVNIADPSGMAGEECTGSRAGNCSEGAGTSGLGAWESTASNVSANKRRPFERQSYALDGDTAMTRAMSRDDQDYLKGKIDKEELQDRRNARMIGVAAGSAASATVYGGSAAVSAAGTALGRRMVLSSRWGVFGERGNRFFRNLFDKSGAGRLNKGAIRMGWSYNPRTGILTFQPRIGSFHVPSPIRIRVPDIFR